MWCKVSSCAYYHNASSWIQTTTYRLRSTIIVSTRTIAAATTTSWSPRARLPQDTPTFLLRKYHPNPARDPTSRIIISYITDIEGDKEYLQRYVKQSKILKFSKRIPAPSFSSSSPATTHPLYNTDDLPYPFPYDHSLDFQADNTMLVHGGDIWDKGGSDLYVIRQLLDLKRRHPDRVIFILGNRDVNKLRLLQELGLPNHGNAAAEAPPPPPPHHPGLWWLTGTGQMGDSNVSSTTTMTLPPPPIPSSPVERLQWLLRDTMGSPDAFRFRKAELAWERQQQQQQQHLLLKENDDLALDEIGDDHVVESYRTSCHPRGEMGQFLSQGQIVARLGQVLFLHGAIPLTKHILENRINKESSNPKKENFWDDLTFAIPWMDTTKCQPQERHLTEQASPRSVREWIDVLNEFAQSNVQLWQKDIAALEQELHNNTSPSATTSTNQNPNAVWAAKGGYHFGPSYSALIQYGVSRTPDFLPNPTVIYNSWFTNGIPNRLRSSFSKKNGHRSDSHGNSTNDDENENNDDSSCDYIKLTKEFLEASQVRLIVSGHQPQGDLPSPIRLDSIMVKAATMNQDCENSIATPKRGTNDNSPDTASTTTGWILCCDTSYSGDTKWLQWSPTTAAMKNTKEAPHALRHNLGRGTARSFRGDVAVTEVLIELDRAHENDLLDVRYHGVLSDGTAYETDNFLSLSVTPTVLYPKGGDSLLKDDSSPPLPVVGQVAPSGWVPPADQSPHSGSQWWTKAILKDGSYVFQAAEGFDRWNLVVSPSSFPTSVEK
jgi:hypothetical protein